MSLMCIAANTTPSGRRFLTEDPLAGVPEEILALHEQWRAFLDDHLEFAHASQVHGRNHTLRVLLYALMMACDQGFSEEDTARLAQAAVFHDTRRMNDYVDAQHGERAAAYYAEFSQDPATPLTYDPLVEFLIAYHVPADEIGLAAAKARGSEFEQAVLPLFNTFKDADGLDRARLGSDEPDESYLRTASSHKLLNFARDLVGFQERGLTQDQVTGVRLYLALTYADAIVVGLGSGMSAAAGYDFYGKDLLQTPQLAPFQKHYGFSSFFDGYYHLFPSLETEWGYLAAALDLVQSLPLGRTYEDLRQLLEGKNYFVISGNVDTQVERAFPPERVCLYQGSMNYLQCKQPCCDHLWETEPLLQKLAQEREGEGETGAAPLEGSVPRCPECGWPLIPWVRDDTFLEGERWQEGVKRYQAFLQENLIDHPERKVLFLELGVGEMSPGIITLPFWDMVSKNPNAFYMSVNLSQSSAPAHLGKRAWALEGDLARVLDAAVEAAENPVEP